MNKQIFMTQLKRHLMPLNLSTRQEILADFEEHFKDGESLGKTAEQVAEELGDPKQLAQQYLTTAEKGEKTSIPENVGRGIFVGLGLLLLDAMIVIPIVASLFAVLISLWAIPLSLFVSALALFISPLLAIFSFALPYYLAIMTAIALLGLTVAMSIGLAYLSKYFIRFIVGFAKMHYNIIVGGIKG
ncbi:MAG: DUF1700 domain-containing protein [Clostridiales bacterium]|nr:DUF1700 domain-containing protein [Clostridiales bacterium]